MFEYIVLLIIGIAAGIMAGLFGIGGGILIVPALIFIMKFPLIQANGTSLAALLLPVGIFAVLEYNKSGFIKLKTAMLIACGMAFGVIAGAEIAIYIPAKFLKILYGIFLIYVTYKFVDGSALIKKLSNKINQKSIPIIKIENQVEQEPKISNVLIFLFGIIAGIMSGMFGIGGGLVIVPFLMGVMKYSPKASIGTSLAALLLPVGLPGAIIYYNAGHLNILYAGFIAAGIVLGAIIGAKISINLPSKTVKTIYGYFLLLVALDFIFL